jgi:hypothetical protein
VLQLTMDLWKRDRDLEALAAECVGRGLLESDVSLLTVIASEDQARESDSFACKSKRQWGKAIGRDGNTAVAAMRRLQKFGVAACEVSEDGYAIVVDWKAVFELPAKAARKADRRGRLRAAIGGGGEEVVRGGEAAHTCSCNQETKPRVACNRDSVSERGAGERVVRVVPHQPSGDQDLPGGTALPTRPWSKRDGLTSDALVCAVRDRDEPVLTGLYFAGIEAGYWQDCEAFRIRFLACCWQAVESSASSPMGLLIHMVRRNLRDRTETDRDGWLTGEADDWAAETRRYWNRERARRESELVCQEVG